MEELMFFVPDYRFLLQANTDSRAGAISASRCGREGR